LALENDITKKSGRRPRVFRTAEERRAEIIEAAFECIQEAGYANLTARRIAERSHISLGHITYNFKDMKEVLLETYRLASRLLYDASQHDLDRSPKEPLGKLRAFLETGFSEPFLKRDYVRVRVDLWSAALTDEDIATAERQLYQRYRQGLAVLVSDAAGSGVDEAEIDLLVDTIMATLDGLWLDWVRRGDTKAVRNGLDGCLRLVEATAKRVGAGTGRDTDLS
jgi:AcrR family transcriptional regulator